MLEPTIVRLEATDSTLGGKTGTIQAIRTALEAAGIVFIDDNGEGLGVKLKRR